jgi:hypothetical protein
LEKLIINTILGVNSPLLLTALRLPLSAAHSANGRPVQDGRIYIEKINGPFLFELKGTPAEYKAGLDLAVAKGWLVMHESGAYVRLTEAGAAMFPWLRLLPLPCAVRVA